MNYLPGEVKSYVENDIFYCPPSDDDLVQPGTLTITNYRLHFEGPHGKSITIPLGFVSRVDKLGGVTTKKKHAYRIEVVLKDTRNVQFALNPENHGRRGVYDRLKTYAFPLGCKRNVFAFSNLEKFAMDGWSVYDPVKEYTRILDPNDSNWVITNINSSYTFCDSYPAVLVVLSDILVSRGVLKSVAAFRSRNRLPVLTWRHASGASLTRSAQPLPGVKNKRSSDDEYYLSALIKANPKSQRLTVLDARPRTNAFANRTRNGGYESEDAYKSTDVIFLNIHSIHVMRDSWNKLKEAIMSGEWTKGVEDTSWLKHIRRILQGSWHAVERLERGTSVLVHCSDGWDRTAQLTALSMLTLDPYYRSILGFEVLIEKEWLSFGHKFQQRIGHGENNHSDSDRSPVFLQFIDCVWQLTVQFPAAFEFNELFLITIVEHLYSCRFGTFLCNNERERVQQRLKQKTVSLWSYINSANAEKYRNSSYEPFNGVLRPTFGTKIRLWEGLYCRWTPLGSVDINFPSEVDSQLMSIVSPSQ